MMKKQKHIKNMKMENPLPEILVFMHDSIFLEKLVKNLILSKEAVFSILYVFQKSHFLNILFNGYQA